MKFPTLLLILALFVLAIGFLVSCKPLDGANPLDTPEVPTRTPIAEGRFGHSNKGITW